MCADEKRKGTQNSSFSRNDEKVPTLNDDSSDVIKKQPTSLGRLHQPVLLQEVLTVLSPQPDKIYCDFTVGCGGYLIPICRCLGKEGRVIGVDMDAEMIAVAHQRLMDEKIPPFLFQLIHGNFAEAGVILDRLGVTEIDGAILDLGLNSLQLCSDRGMSFKEDGPLDLRFDRQQKMTAETFINTASEEELIRVFKIYGDEYRWAKRIARAIDRARRFTPIRRTVELAEIITTAIPPRFRTTRQPPPLKVFLAIRCWINRELENLDAALKQLIPRLAAGGKLLVISYNGNEDRIVKNAFRDIATKEKEILRRVGSKEGEADGVIFRTLTKKPIYPTDAEIEANTRARSARMRVLERCQ